MGYPIKVKLHNTAILLKSPEIRNAVFGGRKTESKKILDS